MVVRRAGAFVTTAPSLMVIMSGPGADAGAAVAGAGVEAAGAVGVVVVVDGEASVLAGVLVADAGAAVVEGVVALPPWL